jgi:hypothetical protein
VRADKEKPIADRTWTPLEAARRRRLRVNLYYGNAMQFVIRLLMGLGLYILLRIAGSAFLMYRYGLPYYLHTAPLELLILVFSAVLLLFVIWRPGSRLFVLAGMWMPALACFVIADWIRFTAGTGAGHVLASVWGYLPYVLPLSCFILLWMINVHTRFLRITLSFILVLLTAFWISDMPKTLKRLQAVDAVVREQQDFYRELRSEHIIPERPGTTGSAGVHLRRQFKTVDPADYRVGGSQREIAELAYVRRVDIVIPPLRAVPGVSEQELRFSTLENIEHHYFYKYSVERRIVLRDFYFSGDTFYRAVYANNDTVYMDNVTVRKQ